jgi:hypothetical protein
MNAVDCYQEDKSPKRLLPQDPIGQHFLHYFHHGWSFLEADMPEWGNRPDWRTETRYPLQPRNLWSDYNDEETLLGLSFPSQTNYMLLDIDRGSVNHPDNNRKRYHGILETMESIGLCRDVPIRSSESEGIHLYYFLPQPVHSFTLAATVRNTLDEAGYKTLGGQLEIFPNPKPYSFGKPTSFKCHRLPLQRGSYLLNRDLEPDSNSITTLLQRADLSAAGQDLETLLGAMEQVWEYLKKQYYRRGKGNAQKWYDHLRQQIEEGFSGFGQTNTLLLCIACFGIVFRKLQGRDLYEYVFSSITESANYHHYCRHQHEIDVRVTDVVRSAQRYYYPYTGKPLRETTTYAEHFGGSGEEQRGKILIFPHPSQKRQEETLARVTAVVAMLKGEGAFPETAYQRTQAIIAKSKEAFGVGGSQTTLHKTAYLPLWHPAHETAPTGERVNPDSTVLKYPQLPNPWDEAEETQNPVVAEVSNDLHVPPLYEGFLYLPQGAGGEPEAVNSEYSLPDTDSFNSTILHDSLEPETIYLQLFNFLSANVSSKFFLFILIILNDKYFQYPLIATANPEKPEIPDKQPLSIRQTHIVICTDPPPSGETSLDSSGDIASLAITTAINIDITADAVSPVVSIPKSIPDSTPAIATDIAAFSPEDSPPPLTPTYTPEQYREAIRIRLHALPQAKHRVRTFCNAEGVALMPAQRQQLEQFVQYSLMGASPSPILQEEAALWFAAHEEVIAQIRSASTFWEYCQNLQ